MTSRKRRKFRSLFIFLALAMVIIYFNDEGQQNKGSQQGGTPTTTVGQSQPANTSPHHPKVRQIVWPPPPEKQGIARDLLAKNYYVVLDCSGSMGERKCSGTRTKLAVAKDALNRFAEITPPDANLGLLIFVDGMIKELLPIGSNNKENFVNAVNSTRFSGGTPLFAAIDQGYERLAMQAGRQLGYGEYTLVVVTDGLASEGQDPTPIVNEILGKTAVQIHTIGFCIGPDHSLNMPGRTVYKAANSPEQLEQGLADVLAESESFDVDAFGQ
jgi:hypothetical protein